MAVKLVEVIRSNIVESVHYGDIAVCDATGRVLHELGGIQRLTYFRSTSKPFQALAALETGITEKFGLDLKEIALMISSHSGEEVHIKVLEEIMRKIGISEKDLDCGIHEPVNKEAARELCKIGRTPSKMHCNCSGKHVGLIAASKALGLSIDGYAKEGHIIQEKIDKVISDFCGIATDKIIKGYDGCGMPIHAVPLKEIAFAFANLCNDNFLDGKYGRSQNFIISAMTMYPEMVAGQGRFDTELMKSFGDRLICKIGAEGVYCVGILGKSIGIALKVDDGNSRAISPAILELLLQMDIISIDELEQLKHFWKPDLFNHRNDKVGFIKPCLKI